MNTPRTDAEAYNVLDATSEHPQSSEHDLNGSHVSADFARQLEAELAAMTALADRMAEALGPFASLKPSSPRVQIRWPSFVHAGRDALAAYENHKKGNTP